MPKQKYLYQKRKVLYNGENQEEIDQVFFKSPKYAKIVAKKYGIHTADVERAMKAYFECMKEMGLTRLIDKDKVRRYIDELNIELLPELGRGTGALTDPIEMAMEFRRSAKAGEFSTLFHEFNHFLSIGKNLYVKNFFDFYSATGFHHMTYLDDGFRGFNEGITEYLARLQKSYHTKQPAVIDAYSFFTAYARQLFFIAGTELYEDYFNGGDFTIVARKLEKFGIEKEELLALADNVSYLLDLQTGVYAGKKLNSAALVEFVNLNGDVQADLISMFGRKINCEVFQNLKNYNSFDEIYDAMVKSYLNYSKALFFGCSDKSMNNYNREDIFNILTDSLLENLGEVINFVAENPEAANFELDEIFINDNFVDWIEKEFVRVNDCNYALVEFGEEEITLENMKDKKIEVYDVGYANYVRGKSKYSKTKFMKNEEYLTEEYMKHGKKALYEEKQRARYVEEEPEIEYIIIEDDGQGFDDLENNKENTNKPKTDEKHQ